MTPLKSLFVLWTDIMYTYPETSPKSIATAQKLFDQQGIEFLTKFLPSIGKILDRSLSTGRLQSLSGITKRRKDAPYPVFLYEYFRLIFDESGYIRPEFDVLVLKRLRTALFFFYKFVVPFTDDQLKDSAQKFVDTDALVKTSDYPDISAIRTTFKSALPQDPMDIRGRHSSGATACGFDNIQRREVFRFIPSLHKVYGMYYFFNSAEHLRQKIPSIRISEPTSRVTFVPKDSRGPRTICMEPHERMYVQQGLMHKIYEYIEKYSPYRGRINFTNQEINRRLAYLSSMDRSYATLDLKDASDLVPWNLIKQVLPAEYLEPISALRTPQATLPDGRTVTLNKFAPMGSALCFPIEAILFFAIARTVTEDCYVYGDDIIVPTDCANDVITALESFGLIVNRDKSLIDGYFRESCGFDAYKGHDITPVRCRAVDLVNCVALANNLSLKFSEATGLAVIKWFESINHVIVPRLPSHYRNSEAIAFYSEHLDNSILFKRRYNKNLQRYEFRFLTNVVKSRKLIDDSYDSLYDYFVNSSCDNSPLEDAKYVEKAIPSLFTLSGSRCLLRSPDTRFSLTKDRIQYKWVPAF